MSNGNQHAVRSTRLLLDENCHHTHFCHLGRAFFSTKGKAGASLYDRCLLIRACIHAPRTAHRPMRDTRPACCLLTESLFRIVPPIRCSGGVGRKPNSDFKSPLPVSSHALARSLAHALHQVTRHFQRRCTPRRPAKGVTWCGHRRTDFGLMGLVAPIQLS